MLKLLLWGLGPAFFGVFINNEEIHENPSLNWMTEFCTFSYFSKANVSFSLLILYMHLDLRKLKSQKAQESGWLLMLQKIFYKPVDVGATDCIY